jgi:hypothetical protein
MNNPVRWITARAALFVVVVSAVLPTGFSRSAEGMAADRTKSKLGASVLIYVNYLFLSELVGKPTAAWGTFGKYCSDELTTEQIAEFRNRPNAFGDDHWRVACQPVKHRLYEIEKKRKFDLSLTYIKIMPGRDWLDKFIRLLITGEADEPTIMSLERQQELMRLHGFPTHAHNNWASFGMADRLKWHQQNIKSKIGTNIGEMPSDDVIGEIRFSHSSD